MNIHTTFRALVLSGALLAVALPASASAAEVRNGAQAVVPAGETVNDDLFASGDTVTIAGNVVGDVYAAASTVVVTGTIDGDLIAAGQQIVVDGTVRGNVRAAASDITVNGEVTRSVTGAAQNVSITSTGKVGGSLVAAAARITTFGPIGRGVTAGAGNVQFGGPVGGKVLAYSENLSFGPNAKLASGLEYSSETEKAIPAGVVTGPVQFHQVVREERRAPVLNGLLDFGSLVGLVGSFILGALVIMLAPRDAAAARELARQQPLKTFGLGLLALFAVPVAALIVGVTLVGFPLAMVITALYWLGVLLAWPALGLVLGMEVARLAKREIPILAALAVGLILLHLGTHLPVAGGLIACLGLAFGLGQLIQVIQRRRNQPTTTTVPFPAGMPA